MPERTFSAGSAYRYGFNGQEKSDEIGDGLTTALFWEYDRRIGRRWNIDPVTKFDGSSYATLGNNPIRNIDPNGDVETQVNKNLSKSERKEQTKALKMYAAEMHNYIKNVQGEELDQLLAHSGSKDRASLLAAWDNDNPKNGAIKFRFSDQAAESYHEDAGGGQIYAHPDGIGSLAGVHAQYDPNTNTISLAYMFFSFYKVISKTDYGQMPINSTKFFGYADDVGKAFRYVSRIVAHEMVHRGPPNRQP